MQNNLCKIIGDGLPTKVPFKDNSKDIHKERCYEVTYSALKKQKHNVDVLATSVTLTSVLT